MRILWAFVLPLIASGPAQALTAQAVFAKSSQSIVRVEALDGRDSVVARGTGTVVALAEVLTNCHVIAKGTATQVRTFDGSHEPIAAELVGRDDQHDLCLLHVKGLRSRPVELGAAATLSVGDPVYAIGSPKGLDLSLSDGIVAQLRGDKRAPVIQTTAPISPGSSGGGLFDARGRLVGITTFYMEGGQNLNFAVPIERLAEVRAQAGERSADVLSAPELPELILVTRGNDIGGDVDIYLMSRSVKRMPDGLLRAWRLMDLHSPRALSTDRSIVFRSMGGLFEFDCIHDSTRMIAAAMYSGPKGQGDNVKTIETRDSQYRTVVPGTPDEAMFKLVCGIGEQGRR